MILIGELLKSLRKARGISSVAAANGLKVTQPCVTMIEKHKRLPQIDYLRKASEFYGTPLSELSAYYLVTDILDKIENWGIHKESTLREIKKILNDEK